MGRDRLLEMLDDDSPAACKLVYEIGRTLAERMAADQRDRRRGHLPPRERQRDPKI